MIGLRGIARAFAFIGLAVVAGSAATFSRGWLEQVPLERITVSGTTHAPHDEIRRLAAVDTLSLLWNVRPAVIADRVRRHPWVRNAAVTRWPTGTLSIRIEERRPVLLLVSADGRPINYLDGEGYAMPLSPGATYHVPLLRGVGALPHPLRPVAEVRIRTLVSELLLLSEDQRALLSEFELRDDELWMRTTATEKGESVHVRLGRGGFREKIVRMHAFWHQAMLAQPDRQFQLIDLRFDGQIVTREIESSTPNQLN